MLASGMSFLGSTEALRSVVLGIMLVFFISSLSLVAIVLLLRRHHNREVTRKQQLFAVWEEKLMAVLMDESPPEVLTDLVNPGEEQDFLDYVMECAWRFQGAEFEKLREVATPYLEQVARASRRSRTETRARAIQILSMLGLPTYAEPVSRALDDPSPLVSMVAARALARKSYDRHAPAIITRLGRFDSWSNNLISGMVAGIGSGAGITGYAQIVIGVRAIGAVRIMTDPDVVGAIR